ncbi:MAG: hypothetical protein F6K10_12380 [Moorea sp. SIO2B7]|nr:hypothetical protein [Moorena sp. SIO2B7]
MTNMQTAYKVASIAVRQRFAEQHPDYLEILNNLHKDDVAVYSGSYDHVEKILDCLGVGFTMNPKTKDTQYIIIFLNCSGYYDSRLINHLKEQVEAGKWLVSSDWALGYFISQAFPNMVRWNKKTTGDEVIAVEPNLNSLWSEVVILGAEPQWWLENSSHPIEVTNPEKVTIEAASHELLAKHNAPVVAVSFDWGKGYVFHVISHFWCKRSRALTLRHQGPCTDFLKAGMKLSDEGVEKVLNQAKIKANTLNFAQLQSAATSTELVAQLCVRAFKNGSDCKIAKK